MIQYFASFSISQIPRGNSMSSFPAGWHKPGGGASHLGVSTQKTWWIMVDVNEWLIV